MPLWYLIADGDLSSEAYRGDKPSVIQHSPVLNKSLHLISISVRIDPQNSAAINRVIRGRPHNLHTTQQSCILHVAIYRSHMAYEDGK